MPKTPRRDLILMVDVFCSCIEGRIMPTPNSPCHRLCRKLVAQSGWVPKRKRMKLPKEPNERKTD